MEINKRLELIRQVGEEIITEDDLKELLQKKKTPLVYDGFEPSGKIHIAQGILRSINTNKMIDAGCRFMFLVADWHAWANNKLGGDLEKIQNVGKYMIEVWKACGMKLDKVEFRWASEVVKDDSYWKKVMQVARNTTTNRIMRCCQIMGRKEGEVLQSSQILYPCMQAADIFHFGVDICQLGMDQRKVNMMAREIAQKLGFEKPVVVSHHMLMGLEKPTTNAESAVERAIEMKMSKSRPDSAIFMTDTEEEIKRKITKAFCPEKEIKENPIIEYCKYLIFEKFDVMKIERPAKFGGNLEIGSFEELEKIYGEGKLHPSDLKNSVAFYINELVKPVREHFEKDKKAKALLDEIKGYEITR